MAGPEAKSNLGSVLVIGGCGFLGSHVVRMLVEDYTCSTISVIDLRCTRNRCEGVQYHDADITDPERLVPLFDRIRPDVVIHTASPLAQGNDTVHRDLFYKVNVEGTKTVVEACKKSGVKALVFTSSASVISDNESDLINADERWPVIRGKKQTEYYSETKAEAEDVVLKANERGKLLTVAIRPSGIFGEADTMVTVNMVKAFRQGKWKFQVGDNNNLFDFTYAGNVAHAHLLAARALLATHQAKTQPLDHERVDGEVFLITNDTPVYFWDFARLVYRAAGNREGLDKIWVLPRDVGIAMGWCSETAAWLLRKPVPTFNRQRMVFSTMTRYYNISKAKRLLGYAPIVTLEEGIRRGVQYILDQEKETGVPIC